MIRALALALSTLALAAAAHPAWSGTEFGNAKYATNKYELEYPTDWIKLGVDTNLTVAEANPDPETAFVTVNSLVLQGVRTLNDLRVYVSNAHPGKTWQATRIGDRDALESSDGIQGIIYALRAEKDVISFFYKQRDEAAVKARVQHVLKSVNFQPATN